MVSIDINSIVILYLMRHITYRYNLSFLQQLACGGCSGLTNSEVEGGGGGGRATVSLSDRHPASASSTTPEAPATRNLFSTAASVSVSTQQQQHQQKCVPVPQTLSELLEEECSLLDN